MNIPTEEEIQRAIEGEDDFGHEMRVGSVLNRDNIQYPANGLNPRTRVKLPIHGETYIDPITGKSRQFDYRLKIQRDDTGWQNVFLALECKNINPDFPMVVCGRPRTNREAYHVGISDDYPSKLWNVSGASSLYKPNNFVGKSILKLKTNTDKNVTKRLQPGGDSEIYDRWSQALTSSHDIALEAGNKTDLTKNFIIPLVVVPDDSLWQLTYNDNGNQVDKPIRVDETTFFVGYQMRTIVPVVLTHIHFVTIKGLSQKIREFANGDSYLWDMIFSERDSEFKPEVL